MPDEALSALLHENRRFDPPPDLAAAANAQPSIYEEAARDRLAFWERQARELQWDTTWTQVLDWSEAPFARWFVGGRLNVAVNCVDRHVAAGLGDRVAFHWQGEPGDTRTVTYTDLLAMVCKCANALTSLGVKAGDKVAIYMPMIPETVVAMLACARIGAPHTVVFGGFSAEALRDRILDCDAHTVITADGGYRRGAASALKPAVDDAVAGCPDVTTVLVVQRTGQDVSWTEGRDHWWHDVVDQQPNSHRAESFDAEHPLYIMYTSGTTAKPKGIFHTSGGYLTHVVRHSSVCLRHQARVRHLLDGGRHRLGDGPQLHRLRTIGQRDDFGDVRGDARRRRPGPLVVHRRDVQGQHSLHGAHDDQDVHEVGGGPAGVARPLEPPAPRVGG